MMTRRDFLRLPTIAWRPAQAQAAVARVARVDRGACIAWADGPCRVCGTRCPIPGALAWTGGPVIDETSCDGCGKCAAACAAVNVPSAISMEVRP